MPETTATKRLNRQLAGTGIQLHPTQTKMRIENEDGVFIGYARSAKAAVRKYLPNGCGGKGHALPCH